jgi:hypothetical protein
LQLDEAVNQGIQTILIEPTKLGNRTITWLTLGKYLRRFSTSMGICCLLSGFKLPENHEIHIITGSLNLILGTFYFISWNSDSCITYRYEQSLNKLPNYVPRDQIRTSKPVILVKDKSYLIKNILHRSIFSISLTYLTYKFFKLCLNSGATTG